MLSDADLRDQSPAMKHRELVADVNMEAEDKEESDQNTRPIGGDIRPSSHEVPAKPEAGTEENNFRPEN